MLRTALRSARTSSRLRTVTRSRVHTAPQARVSQLLRDRHVATSAPSGEFKALDTPEAAFQVTSEDRERLDLGPPSNQVALYNVIPTAGPGAIKAALWLCRSAISYIDVLLPCTRITCISQDAAADIIDYVREARPTIAGRPITAMYYLEPQTKTLRLNDVPDTFTKSDFLSLVAERNTLGNITSNLSFQRSSTQPDVVFAMFQNQEKANIAMHLLRKEPIVHNDQRITVKPYARPEVGTSNPSRILFVGAIPFQTARELYTSLGNVAKDIVTLRLTLKIDGKNFAFLEFQSIEHARRALDDLSENWVPTSNYTPMLDFSVSTIDLSPDDFGEEAETAPRKPTRSVRLRGLPRLMDDIAVEEVLKTATRHPFQLSRGTDGRGFPHSFGYMDFRVVAHAVEFVEKARKERLFITTNMVHVNYKGKSSGLRTRPDRDSAPAVPASIPSEEDQELVGRPPPAVELPVREDFEDNRLKSRSFERVGPSAGQRSDYSLDDYLDTPERSPSSDGSYRNSPPHIERGTETQLREHDLEKDIDADAAPAFVSYTGTASEDEASTLLPERVQGRSVHDTDTMPSSTLYVGRFRFANAKDFYDALRDTCGEECVREIECFRMGRWDGADFFEFAHVDFTSAEVATRASDQLWAAGVKVDFATTARYKTSENVPANSAVNYSGQTYENRNVLFVGNFPFGAATEEIEDQIKERSKPDSLVEFRRNVRNGAPQAYGHAFFWTVEEAEQALENIRAEPIFLNGRMLKVESSKQFVTDPGPSQPLSERLTMIGRREGRR